MKFTGVPISILACLLLASCGMPKDEPRQRGKIAHVTSNQLREAAKRTIEREFAGAKPYSAAIDSLLNILRPFGITPDKILLGQSTCVDDITNTKNKSVHPEIKGPFTIGGLGGIPFTGVTGIDAFAHHVPEDGTALLFVGPHVGYNSEEGWGKILRHGQHHPSTCCGALVGALDKLREGKTSSGVLSEDDYQEDVIVRLAQYHKKEIFADSVPLLALTRLALTESKDRMARYVHAAKERHFPFAVVVFGVIINTDHEFEDYLWIEKVAIKDIKKNTWIRE